MMHGITPPPLGSVKDQLISEMFARERSIEHESLQAISLIVAMSVGVSEEKAKNIFKILDDHRASKLYKTWSIDKKKHEKSKYESDLQSLHRMNQLKAKAPPPKAGSKK